MDAETLERFWLKVDASGDCWEWTASIRNGYGQFAVVRGDIRYAHRIAWELLVGPIPAGLEIDHLCRNRRCLNPDHLEPVSHLENLRRSPTTPQGMTHCIRGHEFTPENTIRTLRGWRQCRTCTRAGERRRSGCVPGANKDKTHCPAGHEYTAENTRVNAEGWRTCRECDNRRARERRATRRAA